MKTTFDPAKREWTISHRGLDFAVDAERVFSGDTITMVDAGLTTARFAGSAPASSMAEWS
jgi:uncharacterized DUF497 family protein